MTWTTTDRTVHNKRPDTFMLEKTIKETYLIDTTTRHSLYRTIIKKLQKSTDRKANKNMATERCLCYTVPLILRTSEIIKRTKREL